MSAFIRFTNIDLNIWDNDWEQKKPWFNIMKVKHQNIILNILGLSTKFEDPFKVETDFTFREIFIGDGHYETFDLLKEFKSVEQGFGFKTFDKLESLLNEFEEKFHPEFKYNVNTTEYLNIINNMNSIKYSSNNHYMYSNTPIITLHRWALPIEYSPIIGSNDLKSIVLWFNTESEALQFRDQLMMEVEDFYKNYASFVKEVILKKD